MVGPADASLGLIRDMRHIITIRAPDAIAVRANGSRGYWAIFS